MVPVSGSATARRHDLDWLRVGAFAVLIFYHIGMFYVTWDWHIKSRFASAFIETPMSLVNPWRLPLLFIVSGIALRFALAKSGPGKMARSRLLRLGVPLLFGFYVVVAPQAYYELLAKGEIGPGFWRFYADYLDFDFEFSILTPTWNHLWYLVYLLVYTLLICLGVRLWPEALTRAIRGWTVPAPVLLLAPLAVLALWEVTLAPRFPVTHALIDDWYTHASSLTFMLFGFAIARADTFWQGLQRYLLPLAGAAVLLGVALVVQRQSGGVWEYTAAARLLRIAFAWAVVLALLGLAARFLNRPSGTVAVLNRALLPCYILHQTLIVCLGAWATQMRLPLPAELAMVLGGTILGCAAGYLIASRIAVLRLLFGIPAGTKRRGAMQVKPA